MAALMIRALEFGVYIEALMFGNSHMSDEAFLGFYLAVLGWMASREAPAVPTLGAIPIITKVLVPCCYHRDIYKGFENNF